jgi:putative ABC transport system permease protein
MMRFALRGLAARKVRGVLTGLAVVLGVAMVSGTFILTDTISRSVDGIVAGSYENTSAVITGKERTGSAAGSGSAVGSRPTVPAWLLKDVLALPEVRAAAGGFLDVENAASVKVVGAAGQRLPRGGFASAGLGLNPADESFSPLDLIEGRWAGAGELVLAAGTADRHRLKVGDEVEVAAAGQTTKFRITGLAGFGKARSVGAAVAVFDVATAQRLYQAPGRLGSISITAAGGVTQAQLVSALRPLLLPEFQVQTRDEIVAAATAANSKETKEVSTFLLAFAGIALFVGAFVIVNTLSITVAQRTRELATLRTLGANRRQVLGAVLLEALVLGLFASAAGLLSGLAFAKGLGTLLGLLGLELPDAATVIAARTVIVSFLVGTAVTVAASVIPALRATRIPPILAVREGAAVPPSRVGRLAPYASVALTASAIIAICVALFDSGLAAKTVLLLLAAGSAALFLGVALLSSRLVRPLAALVGWPAARLGGAAGRLARANAMRNPSRTAATAAALMVGLSLVTFVAVLGRGITYSVGAAMDRLIAADYVVAAPDGLSPIPPDVTRTVAVSPAVERISTIRQASALAFGAQTGVSGFDGELPRLSRVQWDVGSDAALTGLGRTEAVIDDGFAKKHGLEVGDAFGLTTPDRRELRLTVRATSRDSLLGDVAVTRQTVDANFADAQDVVTLVDVRGGASHRQRAVLEQALSGFPEADVSTKAGFADKFARDLRTTMNLFYGLLALSVVVSLFGMVNTLALSVFERTRELGMLRAVGMTRRQARRMVRHESIVTASIGAALGLPLGTGLAALVTFALRDQGLVFDLPVGTLGLFVAVAIASGLVAAILPARRAARLDPLRALQYE